MAQENRAVDLGKLQSELRFAQTFYRQRNVQLGAAKSKLESAKNGYDKALNGLSEAKEMLDKAKQAVLDGARSVAQG